ncbi:hypothetical protein [Nocardioides panaciterrulae]|uniref:Uncharacterized protein n=1 Tax=Nocardioides panaciterrulae TaxID=661492 RepID=A0A7Y9E2I4_9ACTN|nr:hypothetical protein [Nocardioides panaciterrulae]NYD40063.1 hypothetical protein [Nocardioides panaciterrulae]
MLLTTETEATRALAAALLRSLSLARDWLRHLGVPCDAVTDVRVEEIVLDGERRADVRLDVFVAGSVAVLTVEAKLDAPVDVSQLADTKRASDVVVSLVPAGIAPPVLSGVVAATWEDLVKLMQRGPHADAVTQFLADELMLLLDSPAIRRRRRLAALIPAPLPSNWSCSVVGNKAGGDLLILTGPEMPSGQWVQVEVSDRSRGQRTPLRAHVLACSRSSATDPVVWSALGHAAGRSTLVPPEHVAHGQRGRRTPEETSAAAVNQVPASWTYGYGQNQLTRWGWAGFGPRLELIEGNPEPLVAHAVNLAVAIDRELAAVADGGRAACP